MPLKFARDACRTSSTLAGILVAAAVVGPVRASGATVSVPAGGNLQVALNAPERALSMTLAGVGSGSGLDNLDTFRKTCRETAEQFETIGSAEVAPVDGFALTLRKGGATGEQCRYGRQQQASPNAVHGIP